MIQIKKCLLHRPNQVHCYLGTPVILVNKVPVHPFLNQNGSGICVYGCEWVSEWVSRGKVRFIEEEGQHIESRDTVIPAFEVYLMCILKGWWSPGSSASYVYIVPVEQINLVNRFLDINNFKTLSFSSSSPFSKNSQQYLASPRKLDTRISWICIDGDSLLF